MSKIKAKIATAIGQLIAHGQRFARTKFYDSVVKVAKFVSALSSVIAVMILAIPKLTVSTSVDVDPKNSFGTFLAIKNEGHVPAFGVSLSCPVKLNSVLDNIRHRRQTSGSFSLWPGQTATRDCGLEADLDRISLDAVVRFSFPFSFCKNETVTHLRVIKGASGYFLVPDIDQ